MPGFLLGRRQRSPASFPSFPSSSGRRNNVPKSPGTPVEDISCQATKHFRRGDIHSPAGYFKRCLVKYLKVVTFPKSPSAQSRKQMLETRPVRPLDPRAHGCAWDGGAGPEEGQGVSPRVGLQVKSALGSGPWAVRGVACPKDASRLYKSGDRKGQNWPGAEMASVQLSTRKGVSLRAAVTVSGQEPKMCPRHGHKGHHQGRHLWLPTTG